MDFLTFNVNCYYAPQGFSEIVPEKRIKWAKVTGNLKEHSYPQNVVNGSSVKTKGPL